MEKPVEMKAKFHIEILSVLKDAQQQHGLRHKDYQSYHQYISRKLHRMRKSLNFQQGKGNRVIPKKLTKSMVTDSRFLLMKLFEAERAWAHAMQLKSEANTEPRKVYHMRSRLKKAVERANELWELCKWDRCEEHEPTSGAECELCGQCDAHTYIEAQAYLYTMQAVRWFEVSEWRRAQLLYEKAHLEYSALAKAVDKEQQQLYLAKCDELRPLIRYCANNATEGPGDFSSGGGSSTGGTSGDPELSALHVAGGDLDRFNDLLKQIYKNQVCAMTEVSWLGIVIPVKRENVRLAILALNDSNRELMRSELGLDAKIAIYDSMLKTFTDALGSIREDLKGSGPSNSAQITNMSLDTMSRLQILFVYLQYVKLTKTVERNLLIIENSRDTVLTKPQNMARLYDTVMQNLQEMAGLPGLSGTTGDVRHEHAGVGDDAQHEIQARIGAYTAFRCYYLSQAHLLMRRFNECQALLTRTLRHCETALASLRTLQAAPDTSSAADRGGVALRQDALIPGPSVGEMSDKLTALIDVVAADQLICRASRCLSMIADNEQAGNDLALGTGTTVSAACLDLPLSKRLDEFVEDPNLARKSGLSSTPGTTGTAVQGRLIEMCPEFEAIPVKPVFFDLAFYHVKFPSLDEKLVGKDRRGRAQCTAVSDGTAAGKGGITGLVKGWIWGGSK